MLETAEADGYATTLPEAVELCVKSAKGELDERARGDASAPAAGRRSDKPKRGEPKRKSQSAVA